MRFFLSLSLLRLPSSSPLCRAIALELPTARVDVTPPLVAFIIAAASRHDFFLRLAAATYHHCPRVAARVGILLESSITATGSPRVTPPPVRRPHLYGQAPPAPPLQPSVLDPPSASPHLHDQARAILLFHGRATSHPLPHSFSSSTTDLLLLLHHGLASAAPPRTCFYCFTTVIGFFFLFSYVFSLSRTYTLHHHCSLRERNTTVITIDFALFFIILSLFPLSISSAGIDFTLSILSTLFLDLVLLGSLCFLWMKCWGKGSFYVDANSDRRGGVAFAGAVCGSPIFGGTRVQSFSQRVRRGGWSGCYASYFGIDWRFLVRSGSW
ncbi:hypothetical protein ACSQ67_025331 [Phaseolus vulgaris]